MGQELRRKGPGTEENLRGHELRRKGGTTQEKRGQELRTKGGRSLGDNEVGTMVKRGQESER